MYRHGSDDLVRVEQFTVRSWSEFGRQHRERWTESDHDLVATALTHTETGAPIEETHLFAVR